MGIQYSASIIVGLPEEDMREYQDEEGYWDENGDIEFHPDSYDSSSGIVGLAIHRSPDYSYVEINYCDFYEKVEQAINYFKQLTDGLEPKVFLSTRGY